MLSYWKTLVWFHSFLSDFFLIGLNLTLNFSFKKQSVTAQGKTFCCHPIAVASHLMFYLCILLVFFQNFWPILVSKEWRCIKSSLNCLCHEFSNDWLSFFYCWLPKMMYHNTHNQNVTMSVKQCMTQYKTTIKTPCRTSRLQERSIKQKGRRDIPYYINHMSVLSIYVMLLKVVVGATCLIPLWMRLPGTISQ